ncbi:MAG: MFS transporter [Bacilli bacterium]|jgi:MFS family permease|nr:MFS transporter [Bacilli bacterium]
MRNPFAKMREPARGDYDNGRGGGFWWQLIVFCFIGQLSWNIENQWFTLFLNAKITLNVSYTTAMTIVSATLTVIATFIFGTLADRQGQRKKFLCAGYIAWGVSTILMSSAEWVANLATGENDPTLIVAAVMVVAIDGIMSFLGSMAYDSSFNVWVNDHTTVKNKGRVGTVYGIMPVIATILGTVVGGQIILWGAPANASSNTSLQNFQLLFWIAGGLAVLAGVFATIFLKDKNGLKPHKEGGFWHQLVEPFNFKKVKEMPNLKEMLLACVVVLIFYISFNFYFVYLGTWAVYGLGFTPTDFGIIEGIGMILGIALAFPIAKLIDRNHIPLVVLLALVTSILGLGMIFFFVRDSNSVDASNVFALKNIPCFIAIFLVGTSMILIAQAGMIWVRGLFPAKARGQFEGVRCIFFVWLPMFIGTLFGDLIIKTCTIEQGTGIDAVNVPDKWLFFWAAMVCVIDFIPLFFAWRVYHKRIVAQKKAVAAGVIDATLFDAQPLDKEGDAIDLATEDDETAATNSANKKDKR